MLWHLLLRSKGEDMGTVMALIIALLCTCFRFRKALGYCMLVRCTDSLVAFLLFVMSLIYISVLVTEGSLTFQVGTQRSKSYKRSSHFWCYSSSDKQEECQPFQEACFFLTALWISRVLDLPWEHLANLDSPRSRGQ